MFKRFIFVGAATLLATACPSGPKEVEKPVPTGDDTTDVGPKPDDGDTIVKPTPDKPAPEPDKKPGATPEQVAAFTARCRAGIETARAKLAEIKAVQGKRTVANTLEPYNALSIGIDASNSMSGLMQSVHPAAEIRDAARACEQEVSSFVTDLGLDRDLYQAVKTVDLKGADKDTKRLVAHRLRDFRRAGVDKDDATRARIKELNDELTKIGQEFMKNIADDVRSISLDSAADMDGLPADYIKAHRPGKDGKISINTTYPDYIPFMSYATSGKLRKQLYMQYMTRAGDANEALLKQILTLRAEKAKLLGYKTWADYITEDKMMKSGANAAAFIERVVKISGPRAKKDYEELLARKKKDDPAATAVEDWEKAYYETKVKTEQYAYDPQAVRPYFEYTEVEKGLLDITSKMYGISYVAAVDPELWYPGVTVYDVMRDGNKIGRIYLDMHPREGKYSHAAQFTKQSGAKGVQLPEGVLVCNLPDPKDGPAFMEHDDVTTMFHEFGHLMHHILGGQQHWIDQAGVATEWDFVEAPSQMFEEWAWNLETLSTFAKNPKGEVIPKDLVDHMLRARDFGLGIQTRQQMFYAAISLNFHTADPAKLDMTAEIKRLKAKYTPFAFVDGTKFESSFGHLEGYTALYYTYMWSLVIAKDMFTPFAKNGLLNTTWTYRYRDKILAPGGTKDAADLVKDFLGRPFNYKAFEKYLGGS